MAGRPYPLGAIYDGVGTGFAWFSAAAEKVELCLFDEAGGGEQRVEMPEVDGYVALLPARDQPGAAVRLPRARAV